VDAMQHEMQKTSDFHIRYTLFAMKEKPVQEILDECKREEANYSSQNKYGQVKILPRGDHIEQIGYNNPRHGQDLIPLGMREKLKEIGLEHARGGL